MHYQMQLNLNGLPGFRSVRLDVKDGHCSGRPFTEKLDEILHQSNVCTKNLKIHHKDF